MPRCPIAARQRRVASASATPHFVDEYYGSERDYLFGLAEALRVEYEAVIDAGLPLQVDDAFLPHTADIPLRDIVDLVFRVKAGAYLLEMANPRHQHEWRVFEAFALPAGKTLVPGAVGHATNVVEHPELVAERLLRLAELAGHRDHVRAFRLLAWIAAAIGLSWLLGQMVAMPLFMLGFLRCEAGFRWLTASLAALFTGGFLYVVFDRVLTVTWLDGAVYRWAATAL